MCLRPRDEGAVGELGAVVRARGAGVASETSDLVQNADHVGATDAVVDGDIHTLVGEIVGDGQALEPAAVGQRITDKVHAEHLVGRMGRHQLLAQAGRKLDLFAPTHGQLRPLVEAIDLLVVHVGKLLVQQIMQAAIAKAAPRLRQLNQPRRQRLRGRRRDGLMTESIAGQPRKAAGPALAHLVQLEHASDRLALALRG